MAQRTLTELEHRILDYADGHRRLERIPHVVPEFGWRKVVYIARLFRLIDDPAAERERPMLVHQLRRLRDDRRARRSIA